MGRTVELEGSLGRTIAWTVGRTVGTRSDASGGTIEAGREEVEKSVEQRAEGGRREEVGAKQARPAASLRPASGRLASGRLAVVHPAAASIHTATGEVVNYATVEGAAWLEDAEDVGGGGRRGARGQQATGRSKTRARAVATPVTAAATPAATAEATEGDGEGAATAAAAAAAAAAATTLRPHEEHGTPLMKQYLQIKAAYPEHVLLFRLGDFYEMFFEDAVKYVPSALPLPN